MTRSRPVVITRPQPQAQSWANAVAAQGLSVVTLPLIEIRPGRWAQSLATWRERLGDFHAVMFVSPAAVTHFLSGEAGEGAGHWRAWATGPATAKALRGVGVPAARIVSPSPDTLQWDSEALWTMVHPALLASKAEQGGRPLRVLIVRGSNAQGQMAGRDWLAEQLMAMGVQVDFAVAYERHVPDVRSVLTNQPGLKTGIWVFSSSEAIANLRSIDPDCRWQQATAVVTHPRIAQAAHDAGFGVVCQSLPGLDQVLASIKSVA